MFPNRHRLCLVVSIHDDERAEDDGTVIVAVVMQREPIERNVHERLVAPRTAEREMRHRLHLHPPRSLFHEFGETFRSYSLKGRTGE
jgi:hypothetical protein